MNYVGGDMPTFALNFSRSGSQIVTQYYNFLRLGFEGYRRVQQECRDIAMLGSAAIAIDYHSNAPGRASDGGRPLGRRSVAIAEDTTTGLA